MAATPKAKFDAAVNVIRSLPKNGSFQPSHEMMLQFYGFYKQATEGPCKDSKPGFWDVVKKAKWEAWSKLGEMPAEDAMLKYVDELKMIIETMPQTQNVADFMGTLGNFYELVDDKMPFGDVMNSSPKRDVATEDSSIVPQPNGDVSADGSDMNHSLMVQGVMSHREMGNGDMAETVRITVKTLDHNENLDKEGKEKEVLTNGNGGTNQPTNHVNSETESDSEEFCDTSDEPMNIPNLGSRLSASTPLNKAGNHVRFSDTNIIHTEVEVHTGRVSPIEADAVGLQVASMPGTYPFNRQARPLSESMFVNAPSQDSMNISSVSQQSGRGQFDTDFSGDSVVSSDLNQSSTDTVKMRGGGEMEQGKQGGYQSTSQGDKGVHGGSRGPSSGSGSGSRRGLFSGSGGGGGRRRDEDQQGAMDVNEQIAVAMVRLQQDMNGVLSRLSSLETISRHKAEEEVRRRQVRKPSWWPFPDLSLKSAAFIVMWPFIAHFLINLLFKRKRRQ